MKAKLVKEALNEFQKGIDPKTTMGIGQIEEWKKELLSEEHRWGRGIEEFVKSIISQNDDHKSKLVDLLINLYYTGEFEYLDNLVASIPEIFVEISKKAPDLFKEILKGRYGGVILRNLLVPRFYSRLNELGLEGSGLDLALDYFSISKIWNRMVNARNTAGMKEAYDKGANIKAGIIKPYIVAIDAKDMELLEILLKDGADPSIPLKRQGRTEEQYPIRRATYNGWTEGVKRLLKDPRVDPSAHRNSALSSAVREGNQEIVDMLMKSRRVLSELRNTPKTTIDRLGLTESLFEFERGKDPKASMGIGKKAKTLDKLKKHGVSEENVEFGPNGIPRLSDNAGHYGYDNTRDKIIAVGMEEMDPIESDLTIALRDKNVSVEEAIQDAWDEGLNPEVIRFILKYYTEVESSGKIALAKLERTEEEREQDDDENIYIFIGYTDKSPVEINGKKYYEDKFDVENMIKIDKYNPSDLNQVSGMKLRVRYQEHKYPDYGVYMLRVPKMLMDEESYHEIPSHLQDIVEKYKVKI